MELCDAARRIREKNPGRVPIICEQDEKRCVPGWRTKKAKFLVSDKLNVSQFRRFVRGNLVFNASESVGKPASSSPPRVSLHFPDGSDVTEENLGVAELDKRHRSPDGFLYLRYATRLSSKSTSTQPVVHSKDLTASAASPEPLEGDSSPVAPEQSEKVHPEHNKPSSDVQKQNPQKEAIITGQEQEQEEDEHPSRPASAHPPLQASLAIHEVSTEIKSAATNISAETMGPSGEQCVESLLTTNLGANHKIDQEQITQTQKNYDNEEGEEEGGYHSQNPEIESRQKIEKQNDDLDPSSILQGASYEEGDAARKQPKSLVSDENVNATRGEKHDILHVEGKADDLKAESFSDLKPEVLERQEEEQQQGTHVEKNASVQNFGNQVKVVQDDKEESIQSDDNADIEKSEAIDEEREQEEEEEEEDGEEEEIRPIPFVEHPATAADMDALYKSPVYSAIHKHPQFKPALRFNLDEGDARSEQAGSAPFTRTLQISERTGSNPFAPHGVVKQQLDSILYNGFDSMVLSDDSSSARGNDDAQSHGSGGRESTSGWPSLSRESTVEEGTGTSHHQRAILRQMRAENLGAEISDEATMSSSSGAGSSFGASGSVDARINKDMDEWIDVEEDDTVEAAAAARAMEDASRRSSLEKGKAFLIGKVSMLQELNLNKESFKSKAASIRNLAVNMIGADSVDESDGGGAKQSNQFVNTFDDTFDNLPDSSKNDEDEDWTCVNFDSATESFGATRATFL